METTKVTTWYQMKQLAELAQQYSIEDKQYDAPFAVYAIELVRRWQLPNHSFILLYDESKPIGYTIMYTDDTGLNNTLYIYDLYITKAQRGKKGFYSLIQVINQTAIDANIKRGEFPSQLDDDTWQRLTELSVTVNKVITVDNIEYKE